MIATQGIPVRYNEEYFGYLAGYPGGEIILAKPEAGPLLARGASPAELEPHKLTELEVRDGFHLNTPPLIWFELTRRCNLDCPHCYIHGGLARKEEMPASEFYRLLDEFADMGVWAVAFTGGEPTLHPEFAGLVRHARKRELLVGVATNGMFLTQELLNSLPREGVIISVSLDNLHVSREHDFNVATKAILRSQESGFLTNIMTNTNRESIHHLDKLMTWAESHGVSVRSVPFSPLGRGKQHKYLENTVEDVDLAAQFWMRECEWEHEYHKKAGLCVGLIFNYGLTLSSITRRCSSGRFLCYVCADGTVFPCTMCAGEEILSSGNLRGKPFAEFWRSEWEIRKFSWDKFKDTCKDCVINDPRFYCGGRCPALSHARNNSFIGCGTSDFEKLSLITRTAMLERTEVGQMQGVPVQPGINEAREGAAPPSLPFVG